MSYNASQESFFIDIDATLLMQESDNIWEIINSEPKVISGAVEKLFEWRMLGHMIILTTARPNTQEAREKTIRQLEKANIIYDELIMGLPHGRRTVINNSGFGRDEAARGITTGFNQGIKHIDPLPL